MAPAVSAAKPPTGWSCVIRDPIVCTMRQPPDRCRGDGGVGREDTQNGIVEVVEEAAGDSAPAMMPIVFCASLVPCPRL